jgi:hypothetical protein
MNLLKLCEIEEEKEIELRSKDKQVSYQTPLHPQIKRFYERYGQNWRENDRYRTNN